MSIGWFGDDGCYVAKSGDYARLRLINKCDLGIELVVVGGPTSQTTRDAMIVSTAAMIRSRGRDGRVVPRCFART
jgi:hypothetical protein